MRHRVVLAALAVSLFALSCTQDRENPTEPPSTAAAAKPCTGTLDDIQSQICALFRPTDNLNSAWSFYNNILTKLTKQPAAAQARAFDLVNFTFKQFYAGKLLDPNSGNYPTTWEAAVNLTCAVLDKVGDDCGDLASVPASSPSSHATTQICGPAGCLVLPADKHSGVSVPPDACPSPCIISVNPIPATSPRQGPLVTDLDQYLLFRDFTLVADFDEFAVPVIVGICHLDPGDGDFAPPDAATEQRLRLAHPNPSGEGPIEILDKVAAPFLDCADFDSGDEEVPSFEEEGGTFFQGQVRAAGRTLGRALVPILQSLLPEPAEAAVLGSCCLGGATSKFSPWAAVDPFSGPDILSGVNAGDDGFSLYNARNGAVSFVGKLDPNINRYTTPVAMAVRPSDGEVFVWNNSGDGTDEGAATGVLLTVDPGTGQGTPVNSTTPPQGDIGALAFSPSGALYGFADRVVTPEEGPAYLVSDLVSVSPSTGGKTSTTQLSQELRIGGADFNCGGVLYGVELAFGSQRLVTIDPATGTVTVVATLSQDIGVIGSIVFHFGTLIGSAENEFFDINPTNGAVSNGQEIDGFSTPQGLGTRHPCFLGPS
jgi:hypothetical protein